MRIHRLSTLATAASISLYASLALAESGSVKVQVLDRDGMPVPEVVVYVRRVDTGGDTTGGSANASDRGSTSVASIADATMNQSDLAFSPHILVIESGTAVEFPNEDAVRHHVYSFSPAKPFDLTVDSESIHSEKLVFETAGVVTLGCNIHDDMLAYVLVVDTPYFTKTGADGTASLLDLGAGHFEINVWTPRLARGKLPEAETIRLSPGDSLDHQVRFADKLYPAHEHSETSLHWSHY